jgi:outer membrane protein OmpA-like peptidoglycan-associated protein
MRSVSWSSSLRFGGIGLLVFLALFASAEASIKDRPYSLHLDLGATQPALNDSAQVWLVSSIYGGTFQYMLSPRVGLLGSVKQNNFYDDSVSASALGHKKDRANRKWRVTSISAGSKVYLDRRKGATPYFFSTIDLLIWKVTNWQGTRVEQVTNRAGEIVDYSATEIGISAGVGFERLFAERIGFALAGELTFLTGIGADFAHSVRSSRSRALLQFSAAVSVHFGPHKKTLLEKEEAAASEESDWSVRQVYEEVIDSATGDTIFVDKSRSDSQKPFQPILQAPVIVENDSDEDGVVDKRDKCPETPAGALVDRDGCPCDADGDGVPDGIDKCPNTPKEARGLVEKDGCPIDTDLDSSPDYLDKCPNTPANVTVDSVGCPLDSDADGVDDASDLCLDTPRGIPVDKRGCPDLEQIFYKRTLVSLFHSGETRIRNADSTALDSIVILLEIFPEVAATISAYTDDLGPAEANQIVSQKRADAVLLYFVNKGISSQRLEAIGKGETNFIASNRTMPGREQNRRIEIEFKYRIDRE